ncbi:MAG: hypothetical protein RLZ40_298 [Actinomycetota bacterium]
MVVFRRRKNASPVGDVAVRFCVVVAIALASIVVPATPSLAVDYRLEIVTGSFTTRVGERVILTVSTPNSADIARLLTDPTASALAEVSAPLVSRESVAAIVAGGEFDPESRTLLTTPAFRATTLNNQPVFQLNVTTSATSRPDSLRLSREGVRAIRLTLTSGDGQVAQLMTFLNVVSSRSYVPLPVYLAVDVDGAPSLQPDGTIRLGEPERTRLRNLRDLLYRKPPASQVIVRIRPELIDGLTRSDREDDRQLLADLAEKLPENEVLVSTFRPSNVAAYAAASLKSQFEAQLLRGETVLDAVNGPALTSRAVWMTNEPLNSAAVDFLRGFGVTNVMSVGQSVASFGQDIDPARPYALRSTNNGVVLSLADPRYARLLDEPTGTAHESAVAIAAELLAQRAAIAGSTVGSVALNARHIVLSSAAGVPSEPLIATTLLRVLRNSPQVSLRKASEAAPTLEGLARIRPPEFSPIDIAAIQAKTNGAITEIEAVRDVLVTNTGVTDRWKEVVDVANDTSLDEINRTAYLKTVLDQVESVRTAVALPTTSFTFGSRDSDLRISLTNTSSFEVSMRLQLSSPTGKLDFDPPFVDLVLPANGQREVVVGASARSNGLIPVELMLMSPSGNVLDVAEIRVRVNAIAGLGRGVSLVFLVLLALWWVVHTRRRMKKEKTREHPALRSKP